MTNEKLNVIVKYLGCQCNYSIQDSMRESILSISILGITQTDCIESKLISIELKPVLHLTEEDYKMMCKDLGYEPQLNHGYYMDILNNPLYENDIPFLEADWLRNHEYYLNEKLIREFVKFKK